jgi:hypothetical protein
VVEVGIGEVCRSLEAGLEDLLVCEWRVWVLRHSNVWQPGLGTVYHLKWLKCSSWVIYYFNMLEKVLEVIDIEVVDIRIRPHNTSQQICQKSCKPGHVLANIGSFHYMSAVQIDGPECYTRLLLYVASHHLPSLIARQEPKSQYMNI